MVLACAVAGVVAGCAVPRSATRPGWMRISADQQGFVDSRTGAPFVPWGFNYDRDHQMRLLEDYWEAEWPTVAEDFREMRALGANVVRIHLQLARFMAAPDQADSRALAQLRRLLDLAEAAGLHLDLTGLACYRKADVPAWFEALGETERWEVQANFWRAIAGACAHSPAVFCYDLINEPFVPTAPRQPGEWLAGELSGFWYVQALVLDPGGRSPAEIVGQWVRRQVAAIRERDPRHLITLGFLPDSDGPFVQAAAQPLDFVSVHIYPRSGELPQARATLQRFRLGKPLVVEETFPLACRAEELERFVRDAHTDVAGWISFYWGQTAAELAAGSSMGEAITREWLECFRRMKPTP